MNWTHFECNSSKNYNNNGILLDLLFIRAGNLHEAFLGTGINCKGRQGDDQHRK